MLTYSPFKNHLRTALDRVSRRLMGSHLRQKIKENSRRGTKLIMTLLVRDEIDIVRGNIEFHLDHGVDFIIATDNSSVDGTREILERYERKGLLHLIREPSLDYSQAIWVNRMGEIALRQYGADLIFHADADEFWLPDSNSLKNELLLRQEIDVLKVPVINMLPSNATGRESFPADTIYAVVGPFFTDDLKIDSATRSLYLFKYDPKVLYRLRDGYRNVNQGNHVVLSDPDRAKSEAASKDIRILHYPIRSHTHFLQKIRNGGASYERNVQLGKQTGWQWRLWYDAFKAGNLDQVYNRLTLSPGEIATLTDEGVVKNWSRMQQKIISYL